MLYNVASCWLYLKEYINDARSHEGKKKNSHDVSLVLSNTNCEDQVKM